ncbi:MAG: tetratricopeptide repeat protein [Candidatus Sulfotelmatobacter sp.]
MNQRFTLDVPSFQKLLEAAWVLQCERDYDLSQSRMIASDTIASDGIESETGVTILAVPSHKDAGSTALALLSPDNVFEPVRAVAEAHTPLIGEISDPSVVPKPVTVASIYPRTQVAGTLALAPGTYCSPLDAAPPFSARPDVFENAVGRKNESAGTQISRRVAFRLVRSGDKYRVALRLVPATDAYQEKKHALAIRAASVLKRASGVSAAYGGPVVVLVIMLAFVFSLLGIHGPALTAVKAAALAPRATAADLTARDSVGQARSAAGTGSGDAGTMPLFEPPALAPPALESATPEPSHLRITDATASSRVGGLSLYEMQTLSRQAQYGDDIAALTLGMAYEIGRNVPQSCTQAAHWIAVAAEEGNSAAQYNLALRYFSGDGTPTNLEQARTWLNEAAGHGYQKARLTLEASGL